MNHCYILFICFLLITVISSRALYYDELDEDDDTKLSSNEDGETQDLESRLSNLLIDNDDDDDNLSFDSYEEKKFYQRALFSSSRATHTMSPHTRQAIIDILQKAIDQGWRPNLKHYIPGTRFGRHGR